MFCVGSLGYSRRRLPQRPVAVHTGDRAMASQFPAEVYRDVANRLREQARFANSRNVRADIEAIAHGYDLMAEGFKRPSAIRQSVSAEGTGVRLSGTS
jgi:hypothetical protein